LSWEQESPLGIAEMAGRPGTGHWAAPRSDLSAKEHRYCRCLVICKGLRSCRLKPAA